MSGDFLKINGIFEDLKTSQVNVNGYRLRRCSYLRPLFYGKLNELFMLIEASEDDCRPTMIQGLQSIPLAEILRKRNCEFTDKDYDAYDVRMANRWAPAGLKTSMEIKDWIFRQGTLICRYVHTVVFDHNSVSYSGEVRKLYRRETDQVTPPPSPPNPVPYQSRKRRPSIEQIDSPSPSKRRSCPARASRYTLGDAFCGIGGASEGASQANLVVKWGLEKDTLAMHGYAANFPSAEALHMDAHDFPAIAKRCEHGVDILHLSCPCCYWSEAHTSRGKNDQENMETILTVGPFLKAVKPRYATLEQAPGLLKLKKHRIWFRKLINEIISTKYNVRWRVTDQSEYGVPQRRRRLVFLCAKQGLPLPAFPKPVHGPKDSNLAYWVTVADALEALERRGARTDNDEYHQPAIEKLLARPRDPVDPRTILAKCITTSGGENIHPSGLRKYTPREIAQLQGFPLDYKFTGSRCEATKQAGNAWAPIANTKYFLLLAQFLEAWDMGYVEAEDDVEDLYDYLEDKGIRVPNTTQYLKKLVKTVVSKKKHPLWGSTYQVDRAPPRQRALRVAPAPLPTRTQRQVRDAAEMARQRGEIIDLD